MMLKQLPELIESPYKTDLNFINHRIRRLNHLINQYNSELVRNKPELLMEIYQSFETLDASLSSFFFMMEGTGIEHYYLIKIYEPAIENLKKEFKQYGVDFVKSSITAWDLENNSSQDQIPSVTRFILKTQPSLVNRMMGYSISPAITKAIRLLDALDQSSIKKDTVENYYNLVQIRDALRDVLAIEEVSSSDAQYLTSVISAMNRRIADILKKNPSIKALVFPSVEPSFSQSLANMSSNEVMKIISYLKANNDFDAKEFHTLFDSSLKGLEHFDICFLGGSNAKNYVLTDQINQEKFVLKIIPVMGNSRKTIERLKKTGVNHHLADVFVSRENLVVNDQRYSIEVTEFCSKGDLLSYGKKSKNDKEKYAAAAHMYEQMSNILLSFQANNALFPDMKPANFLVNAEDQLVIADFKSFVDILLDEQRNQIVSIPEINKTQYYLYTETMEPPEIYVSPHTSLLDKHHAYLMGYSLYLFLTGKNTPPTKEFKSFFDFDLPIFKTTIGKEYQTLIQGLLEKDPEKRLGIQEAKERILAIQYGIKLENSPFKSKTEAYCCAIDALSTLQKKYEDKLIGQSISEIKILLENHEKNPTSVAKILDKLILHLNSTLKPEESTALQDLSYAIRHSAYQQTLKEKYENPLARRFESQMQIELLLNPTKLMMNSVGGVSKGLLQVIEQMENDEGLAKEIHLFAKALTSGKNQTGFGSQTEEIDLKTMKTILEDNKPSQLNQILFIHFLFAQKIMRVLPDTIQFPNPNKPTGKLLQIIEEFNDGQYKNKPEEFFKVMDYDKLRLISDVKIYGSSLYKAEENRGRKGSLENIYSSQMGLMLVGQTEDGLPKDQSSWTPDSKYQAANLDSIYVRDLIENDGVYASGPSGMTSLFLNIMELYGNFSDVKDKQNYLAAVSAYMVAGGLHSLHEVIGPAQYALELVPGYQVTPPDKNKMASPPNFHQFYQQQMDIDPEFKTIYDNGWDKMMTFYAKDQSQFIHAKIATIDEKSVIHKVTTKKRPMIEPMVLTPEKASDRLVNHFNKAVKQYSSHILYQSPIVQSLGLFNVHGQSGIDRAVTLLEKARNQDDFFNVLKVLHDYFSNELTSESGESYISKSRTNNHSFISFLLNELKQDQELIHYINQLNLSNQQLKLDEKIDYTSSKAKSERVSLLSYFESIKIKQPELTIDLNKKQKEFKKQLNQIEQVDDLEQINSKNKKL